LGPNKKRSTSKNPAQIKLEVQKLYGVVGALKEQVDKSDATSTLSLPVVKKEQEIEKLAKQIKDRAKGQFSRRSVQLSDSVGGRKTARFSSPVPS
jgi:hypothetical protein